MKPIATVLLAKNREGILEPEEVAFLERQLEPVNMSAAIASAAKLPTMLASVVARTDLDRLVEVFRAAGGDDGERLCAWCDETIGASCPRVSVWIGEGDDPEREAIHLSCAADLAQEQVEAKRLNKRG